jgi:hypothetical protein
MFKFFIMILAILLYDSSVAIGGTLEKWSCQSGPRVYSLRYTAAAVGEAPCKIFFSKKIAGDTGEVILAGKEDSGEIKPIYIAYNDGSYCPKKLQLFLEKQTAAGWICEHAP